MNDNRNIAWYKGFTLLEMILVMILSGVVVSMVYLVLSNTGKEWKFFYTNRSRMSSMVLFKQMLMHDLYRTDYIYVDSMGLYGFAGRNDTIVYRLGETIVRAHGGYTDTFLIAAKNIRNRYVPMLAPMNIIAEIELDIQAPVTVTDMVIRKEYASASLMQLYTQKLADSLWTYAH